MTALSKALAKLPAEELDQLLSIKDVCDFLSISKRTAWRWVAEGILPQPIRFTARCDRWKASDIQRVIDDGPLRSAPEVPVTTVRRVG
jgi:prophage regulatory protein